MNDYAKKVEEAPYHPGYEDAVITPRSNPVYQGMDPTKLLWKTKPLSDEEIYELWCEADNTELLPEMRMKDGSINYIITTFARAIEERHGIK
jgi:hypothetical protein